MPHQKYTLVIGENAKFIIQLDRQDQAQKDVLAHLTHGQTYEHETSLLFLRVLRSGDVVIDVGGNAGYFSLLAASLVGPQGAVVTAEANPSLAELIRGSAGLNGIGHLHVEEVAVSDQPGSIVFGSNGDHDSNGGVVPNKRPGDPLVFNEASHEYIAQAETLDSIAARHRLEHIKLLKIDTEGHEMNVLRSAQGLLREGRVGFIACELNLPGLARNGTDQMILRNFALEHGYHTFLLDHDGGLPRLVPPGTVIDQPYTCNVLLARMDRLAAYWPVVVNHPAAIRIFKPA